MFRTQFQTQPLGNVVRTTWPDPVEADTSEAWPTVAVPAGGPRAGAVETDTWPQAVAGDKWPQARAGDKWPQARAGDKWPQARAGDKWPQARAGDKWPQAAAVESDTWPRLAAAA